MKSSCKFFFIFISVMLVLPSLFCEQTIDEQRTAIIKYGLEPEVIDLVSALGGEKDVSHDSELADLFKKTKSLAIRETIIKLFTAEKNTAIKDYALTILNDPYDTQSSTVQLVFSYVIALKVSESLPSIRAILKSEDSTYRDKAIAALGDLGQPEDAAYLVEYLDSEISGDDKQRLIIRQNVMTALGKLKAINTWDKLVEVVKDKEENSNIRATAAVAIGNMGKPEAIPVLSSLFEDSDPVLRTASITALTNFDTSESNEILIEGFKDTYYKVRLQSIIAMQQKKMPDAIPYLLYRAKNDPVETVKLQAFEALGSYNTDETKTWLQSIFLDEKSSDAFRLKAASTLLQNNPDFIFPDIEKVSLQVVSDDKKKNFRYELGKLIAANPDQRSSNIASAFLGSKDVLTKSLGLDMYAKNKYPGLKPVVEGMAADEKLGALQRRAKKILSEN
jgi:HEAT repeat protein